MTEPKEEQFDWIHFKKQSDALNPEGFKDKFIRRTKENPFVPIGIGATVLCLTFGLISFRRGESKMSQLMMRGRIFAQGFTVAALIGGLVFTATKTAVEPNKPSN